MESGMSIRVIGDYIEFNGERFAKVTDERVLDHCKTELELCGSEYEYTQADIDREIDSAVDDAVISARETGEQNEFERIADILADMQKESILDEDDVETIMKRISA
jgi:hypothetical protein